MFDNNCEEQRTSAGVQTCWFIRRVTFTVSPHISTLVAVLSKSMFRIVLIDDTPFVID